MAETDDAWKALLQVNDWIKVADTKAGAILAGCGVLGGVLARTLPQPGDWGIAPWQTVLTFVSLALTATSAVITLRVFAPRLRTGEARSLLYFDHIARRYPKNVDFKHVFLSTVDNPERMREAIVDQLWANSHVARKKFRRVAIAIWLFSGALLVALIVGVLKGL